MASYVAIPRRSMLAGYILWAAGFIGLCGLHRLYTGRVWTGLLWFFTGGLFFVGQIVDAFLLPGHCDAPQ